MKKDFLLRTYAARDLYEWVRRCPIYDFHCHLTAEDIYHDRPFDDVGRVMLGGDHYKWRLMRAAGISEELITGDASWRSKFIALGQALELAVGNPVKEWTDMELAKYFGIDEPLCSQNAAEIYDRCAQLMSDGSVTPRSLIRNSDVAGIATTDDPADSLEYHRLLKDCFEVPVVPTFRSDRLFLLDAGFADYIARLSEVSGVEIKCFDSLVEALGARLDYFVSLGCTMSDVGIQRFPDRIGTVESAREVFAKALRLEPVSNDELMDYTGCLFVRLACMYAERDVAMQLHTGVMRNVNSAVYNAIGGDCGIDCAGEPVPVGHIAAVLDAANSEGKLPRTILYCLDGSTAERLSTLAGCFRGVICGSAWWFCDHADGIARQLTAIARTGSLGTFPGMVTDSRSFLSYARHDYFRRTVCSLLGQWVEQGDIEPTDARNVVKRICCDNALRLMKLEPHGPDCE